MILFGSSGLANAQQPTDNAAAVSRKRVDQLLSTSRTLLDRGDYRAAEGPALQALALTERAFGAEHGQVATVLVVLGKVYLEQNELDRALLHYQRALDMRRRLLGDDHLLVAEPLNGLATARDKRGEYQEALTLYEQALAINLREQGATPLRRAETLHDQAALYLKIGAYDRALPQLQQALAIVEKERGPDHAITANPVHTLGSLYLAKGEYEKAEAAYRRALAIREDNLVPDHPDVLDTVLGLANVYLKNEQYDQAAPLYERARDLTSRVLGPGHARMAAPLERLGLIHAARGQYALALQQHRQALAIRQANLDPEHYWLSSSYGNLALVHAAQNEHAEAVQWYKRALAIRERALGEDHPEVADLLDDLALSYWALGDQAQAQAYFARAVARREVHFRLTMNADSTPAKRLFLTNIAARLSDVIAFAMATQASPTRTAAEREQAGRIALDMLLQHKGRVLDAMTNALSKLRAGLNPEDQALLDRYRNNRSRYATVLLRGAGPAGAEAHRKTLRELQTEAEALERDIGSRSQAFQAQTTGISAAAVQSTLDDNEVLIEWIRYRPRNPGDTSTKQSPEHYAACIVRRTGAPMWIDLGPVDAIDAAVAKWRIALMANLASADTQARDLDALVMAPIRQRLGISDTLYLAPDGALNLIPFAALRDEDNRYLVDRYRLHYLTSGRDRVRPRVAAPARSAPLIVANPRYDLPENPPRHDFAPLASVLDEARAVAALYPNATLLTDEQATEEALKNMRGPALLHIATHGYFEPLHCGDGAAPSDALATTPTLQSGLVLAGANGCRSSGAARGDGTGDDGLLTALELAALDLQGTELAVLSACDTAVGTTDIRDRWGNPTGRADGVYGLRRALILAGAETQLMTLWKVEDRATRRFMAQLYRHLAQGMERSEALRAVQMAAIRQDTPPRVWAAFIMAGLDGPLQAARPALPSQPRGRGCGCDVGRVGNDGVGAWWGPLLAWLLWRARRGVRRWGQGVPC